MTEPSPADAPDAGGTAGTYGGVFGAFPYAFRTSDSVLFRLYVLVGGLLAALAVLVFTATLVVQVAATLGGPGGTFSFFRTLIILLGLFVVVPIIAPILLVARRHRRAGSDTRYDALLAAAGVLFIILLYLGVVVSTPPEFMESPAGPFAPFVELLYATPALAAPAFPLVGAALIALAHRYAD